MIILWQYCESCVWGVAGFDAEVQKANGGNAGAAVLMQQASERALLTGLLARLRTLDPDAIVGHNLTAFDMDVLLHRLQAHKVCTQPLSRILIVSALPLPTASDAGPMLPAAKALDHIYEHTNTCTRHNA